MAVIKNVVFNYVKIKKPAPKYGKKPGCPINDCEYTVDVCLPADTAKALKKKYKTVKAVKNMATYDAEDYKKTFKCEAPDAAVYANSDDEYSILKLTAFAGYKDGSAVPEDKAPDVFGTKAKKVAGDGKAVGRDIEVGNGSTGKVSFVERPWEFEGQKGLSLDLGNIQIETLVEYESKGGTNGEEFEFEEEEGDEFSYESEEEAGDSPTGDGDTPDDDDDC